MQFKPIPVITGSANHGVITPKAFQLIITCFTIKYVIPSHTNITLKIIITFATKQYVIAVITPKTIIAGTAIKRIITFVASDTIITAKPLYIVIMTSTPYQVTVFSRYTLSTIYFINVPYRAISKLNLLYLISGIIKKVLDFQCIGGAIYR